MYSALAPTTWRHCVAPSSTSGCLARVAFTRHLQTATSNDTEGAIKDPKPSRKYSKTPASRPSKFASAVLSRPTRGVDQEPFRPPRILFRDQKVIVINKPPGTAIQGEEDSDSLARWNEIVEYCKAEYGPIFPVHRLDKSTSGPLILARSANVARTLSTAFQNGQVKKTYLALVQFLPERNSPLVTGEQEGLIQCRMRNRNDKMVLCEENRDYPEAKESSTTFRVVTATANHALLSLTPHTGRKHQLRLHCARLLNAPIVGDYKYDFRYNNDKTRHHIDEFLKREAEARIMLHASEVEFELFRKELPKKYTVKVSAPMPRDFRVLCDQLDLETSGIDGI